MLYHPEQPYILGRTNSLLKVKSYWEEDVKFIECNPNSYTFNVNSKYITMMARQF